MPQPAPLNISASSKGLVGNATSDGFVSNYQWDAESQLKSAAGVNYLYDGDGRRVAKVGSKLYWYGSGGDILAESTTSGATTAEYIFFGGKRLAMIPSSGTPPVAGNPTYYVEDLLGTSRVLTNNAGVVCYDADFYPYGGERSYLNTCPQNYKFEGKERDSETGNDDFGARYYSNRFGHWLSPDWSTVPVPVPYASLTNPQTLNLYSMVADDPETFADLDGHIQLASQGTSIEAGGVPSCLSMGMGNSGNIDSGCSKTDERDQDATRLIGLPEPMEWHWEPTDPRHPDPKDPKFKGFKLVGDYDGEVIMARDGHRYVWDAKLRTWLRMPDPDEEQQLRQIANGIVKGAGGIADAKFIACFYAASAIGGALSVGGAGEAAAAAADAVPEGTGVGTRILSNGARKLLKWAPTAAATACGLGAAGALK